MKKPLLLFSYLIIAIASYAQNGDDKINDIICSQNEWKLIFTNIDSNKMLDTTMKFMFSSNGNCKEYKFIDHKWQINDLKWNVRKIENNPLPVLQLSNGEEYFLQRVLSTSDSNIYLRLRQPHWIKGSSRKDYYFK